MLYSMIRRLISRRVIALLESAAPEAWVLRQRLDNEWQRLRRSPELNPALTAQQLLVSGEDHRHATHPGFDLIAIARALWRRVTRRSREGASTIEQQIVRVITGRYERTVRRKLKEILLATLVAHWMPKSVLPSIYLAIGYYGWRMNGYVQACGRLGLCPSALSLDEAAGLVARLKYPEPKRASSRRVQQIDRRVEHLRILYQRHRLDGTYRHLNETALRPRAASFERVPQT